MPLEFHLTYRGPVYSGGNRPNGTQARKRLQQNKHALRLVFHQQLMRFCELPGVLVDGDTTYPYILDQGTVRTIGKFKFFALGGKRRHGPLLGDTACKLDILLLRPLAVTVGDLDGKLKTIFDALHLPNAAQLTHVTESQMPRVTHCVVEDDDQITAVNARYDYLLDAKTDDELFVVIHVLLQPLGRSLT